MEILQVNEDQQKKLATVLKNFRIQLFEYIVDEDKLVVYDDKFHIKRTVTDYMEYIDHKRKSKTVIYGSERRPSRDS